MKNTIAPLLILLIFLSISCTKNKTTKNIQYYTIDFPISPINSLDNNPPLTNATYSILTVQMDSAFDTKQIVLKDLDKNLIYFSDHLWREAPAKLVDSLLSLYIKNQNIFRNKTSLKEKSKADYLISSHIYQLLIAKTIDDLEALLYFKMELIENKTDKVEVSSTLYSREILVRKDLHLFSELISQMFKREFDSFSVRVISYFQKQATKESS